MTVRFYSSTAVQTSLNGGITSGSTSMVVNSVSGFPTSYPYTIVLDYGAGAEEIVDVTNAAGLTLSITRGVDGSSAQAHSSGAIVKHVATGRDFTDSRTHENTGTNVHGLVSGAVVVGTTTTQTLTNKTLTAPAISAPVITGGGSMAGTFTGTPTFDGAVVLSGSPVITTPSIAGGALSGTFSGTPTFSGAVVLSGSPVLTSASITGGNLAGTFTGSPVFSGNPDFTGTPTFDDATFENIIVTAPTTAVIPLEVNTPASHATSLFRIRENNANRLVMDQNGALTITNDNATASVPLTINSATASDSYALRVVENSVNRVTLDASGVIDMNARDTSRILLDLNAPTGQSVALAQFSVNNVTKFEVSETGQIGIGPTWVTYSPAWTGATTDPVIGNGTIVGRYIQIGKLVTFDVVITAGTTTTFGSGQWLISTPVTMNTTVQQRAELVVEPAGSADRTPGIVVSSTSTTMTMRYYNQTTGTASNVRMENLAQGAPFTLNTGDVIRVHGTVEAA